MKNVIGMNAKLTIQKIEKNDVKKLYTIALRAFYRDYEKYGFYPPLINLKKEKFLPPLFFGKTIKQEGKIIGGIFSMAVGSRGEIGAIFLDSAYQGKGIGRDVLLMLEDMYPKVKQWKLETLADNIKLHQFYEDAGYVKTKEIKDKQTGMIGYVYKKQVHHFKF